MYALARNSWKFQNRDKRISKTQHIEFEPFAPDTVEEIFVALRLLKIWTAKAALRQKGESVTAKNDEQLSEMGHALLSGEENMVNSLEVLGEKMENTKRKTLILKPWHAYHAYLDMLHYYAVMNLLTYMRLHPESAFSQMSDNLKGQREKEWVNLGGQIMQKNDLDKLRSDIGLGKLNTWKDIHGRYDDLWNKYSIDKQKHAYAILCALTGTKQITKSQWDEALRKILKIQQYISDQVYASRKKDYDNPFRWSTFRNNDEMKAAVGTIDDNSFIVQVRKETEELKKFVEEVKDRH
jgi:hypothetical protein